jgi:hypothetical protein
MNLLVDNKDWNFDYRHEKKLASMFIFNSKNLYYSYFLEYNSNYLYLYLDN